MDEPAQAEEEHRFLVASAEEAVKTIREQLGENAQVISVRRVERSGIKKLFGGPQLEVVARVPTPTGTVSKALGLPAPALAAPPTQDEAPVNPWDLDALPPTRVFHTTPKHESLRPLREHPAASAPPPSPPPKTPDLVPEPAAGPRESSRLLALLRRGGLGDVLLARLQSSPGWSELERLPIAAALPKVAETLRRQHQSAARTPLGTRVAFVGVAGAGSTAMLCKHLARCVFSQGKPAAVFRLDTGRPSSVNDLASVCELWGVPLLRSEEEMPAVRADTHLYVDVPGLTEAPDGGEEAKIAGHLEKLSIPSRVFVLNAAYELPLLKGLCRRATLLGCQHLAFSHLDELVHWGKLWEFLLHRELSTEFYSLGAGVPGDFSEDVLELTLGKTFV